MPFANSEKRPLLVDTLFRVALAGCFVTKRNRAWRSKIGRYGSHGSYRLHHTCTKSTPSPKSLGRCERRHSPDCPKIGHLASGCSHWCLVAWLSRQFAIDVWATCMELWPFQALRSLSLCTNQALREDKPGSRRDAEGAEKESRSRIF
jgi:hypothetical protein